MVIVDITYRHRQPHSRLEQLLAWLLPAKLPHEPVATQIDFVLGADIAIDLA